MLDNNANEEAEKAIEGGFIPRERCLVLSHGDLEDYYPWPILKESLNTLFEKEIEEPIPVGSRVADLRKVLRGQKGNAWKVLLAEDVVSRMTRENAESDMNEIVSFLRKIYDELSVE